MKYIVAILSAGLLVLGILVYYQGKHAARQEAERISENQRFQQRVSEIQATLLQERGKVERIRAERVKTDSIFRVSENALKREIRVRDKKISDLRVPVASLIDSVADLKVFVAAYDSSLAVRDSTISLLSHKIESDSVSHQSEVVSLEKQITDLQTGAVENLQRIDGLERSLAKAQKKANKRIGFGINGGYGIQEHGGEVTAGPTISAGIHWTIFRF